MRNAGLEETQAGVEIAGRNINNLRYADDTTLMAESEECRGPALVDPGNLKVGTALASLEITYLITDREGLEN